MSPIWTMLLLRVPCPSYEYCVSMNTVPPYGGRAPILSAEDSYVDIMLTGFCFTLETAVFTQPPWACQASAESLAWGGSILA